MEYSFVINAANDVSDNYVNTAIETCKEFLELFPEYKDKFDIKIRYSGKEVSAVSGKSIDFDGTISKEQFEQFYPNGNDEFIALPNGRYLVPGESMAWYEAYAKQGSDGLNYDKISPKQRDWANKYLRNQNPTRYFHVGITNKKLYNNDGLFGYGISSPEIGTVVSTSGFDKETFKMVQTQKERNLKNYTRKHTYVYMQKIVCSKCNKIMGGSSSTSKNKPTQIYYKCNCCNTRINEKKIEKPLMLFLNDMLDYYLLIDNNFKSFFNEDFSIEIEKYNKMLDKCNKKLKKD